jgi:hypothetical protein
MFETASVRRPSKRKLSSILEKGLGEQALEDEIGRYMDYDDFPIHLDTSPVLLL